MGLLVLIIMKGLTGRRKGIEEGYRRAGKSEAITSCQIRDEEVAPEKDK